MDFVFKAITYVIPLILSLTVHEYAHARVAYMLGDDTAARMGRMTLNPIPHIDLVGTIILPIMAAFMPYGIPLIGWAKPVPVMPVRYTRKLSMHVGDMIVSVAGPVSNFLLASVCAIILKVVFSPESLIVALFGERTGSIGSLIQYFLAVLIVMNMGLGVFNLIPIPPLDGSHLLPRSLAPVVDRIRPFSYLILIGVVYFMFQWLLLPIKFILEHVFGLPW
ncbi:MAG: site-2 protease family protein [Pseudomonadota bacterium]